jgi:hypothetical protein
MAAAAMAPTRSIEVFILLVVGVEIDVGVKHKCVL